MTFTKWLSRKDGPSRAAVVSVTAAVVRSDWHTPKNESIRGEALSELEQSPEFMRMAPADRAALLAERRLLQAELHPLDKHHSIGGKNESL